MTSAIAINNARAGSAEDEAVESALTVLRTAYEVEAVASTDDADLDAAIGEHEIVIAMGGDGSLHAVVAALLRLGRLADVAIGLIPLGTGNDFARSVGISHDPAEAARLVVDGHRIVVDLIRDDAGGSVINAVHLGAGAEAAQRADTWKEALGPIGYGIGALISGLDTAPLAVQVSVDGTALPAGNGVLQVAINNGTYVGAGTPLAPQADPCDGQLDVLVSYSTGAAERLSYARDLREGTHVDRDDVMTVRGSTVTVHGEPFSCSADGELIEGITERTWHIEPGAVSMFAPGA